MRKLQNYKIDTKNKYLLKDYKYGDKLPITSNTMMEVMFCNNRYIKYLKYLLELILKVKIDNVTLIKNNIDVSSIKDKKYKLDVVCLANDKILNIEINSSSSESTLNRNFKYLSELFGSNIKCGSKKYLYKPTIQININNYSYKGYDEVIDEFYIMNKNNILYTDKVKIINIYLGNIKKKIYNNSKLSEVEKLLLVMCEKEEREINLRKDNKIMEEYVRDAKKVSLNREIYTRFMTEEEYEDLINLEKEEIKEKSYILGEKKGVIKTAKKMLNKKLPIDIIEECTGLKKNEINRLI